MSSIKEYKSELVTYLGRFYQDTNVFYIDMLPDRVKKNIDKLKPFLDDLKQKGYIEVEYVPVFFIKVITPPLSMNEL